MRTIIFRGKRVDNGEWVYGYVDATMYKDLVVIHSEASTQKVDPETVGQFTGLFDKNGKEIYEGDILDIGEGNTSSVVYKDKLAAFDLEPRGLLIQEAIDYNGFLVIGNIHDRKEETE